MWEQPPSAVRRPRRIGPLPAVDQAGAGQALRPSPLRLPHLWLFGNFPSVPPNKSQRARSWMRTFRKPRKVRQPQLWRCPTTPRQRVAQLETPAATLFHADFHRASGLEESHPPPVPPQLSFHGWRGESCGHGILKSCHGSSRISRINITDLYQGCMNCSIRVYP
jgi:hypothetical protein